MLKFLTLTLLGAVGLTSVAAGETHMTQTHIANMNRNAIIASGGRCRSVEPSMEEQNKIDNEVDDAIQKLVKDQGEVAMEAVVFAKKVVNVHYHVISKTDGTGDVSEADIKEQHQVLKTGFSGMGFKFVKVNVTRTTNNV